MEGPLVSIGHLYMVEQGGGSRNLGVMENR